MSKTSQVQNFAEYKSSLSQSLGLSSRVCGRWKSALDDQQGRKCRAEKIRLTPVAAARSSGCRTYGIPPACWLRSCGEWKGMGRLWRRLGEHAVQHAELDQYEQRQGPEGRVGISPWRARRTGDDPPRCRRHDVCDIAAWAEIRLRAGCEDGCRQMALCARDAG